jgi:hypothetical protein
MTPARPERWLILMLRLAGGVMLLALPAVLMPADWMRAHHAWIGLGTFPDAPLTEYLTRSISLLYGVHGGLMLVVSRAPRRHRPVVAYLAWTNVLFGLSMVAIDLHAGMPLLWTLAEGPPITGMGVVLLWLLRGVGD